MQRLALVSALLFAAASWMAAAPRRATIVVRRGAAVSASRSDALLSVKLNGHTFTLPDGFTVELAAGPPLVDRPITAAFDEKGRLYVAESSGTNEPVKVQLAKKPHRILRLEDTDNDGKFDKRTVFADRMMFPEGTMWHAGSLYVAAPPSIWKLTDTDNDGVADKREEWFEGKTLTGCANDLHGPYLGPDGWVYWCKGAFAEQKHTLPSGKEFVTKASHIFRCRPPACLDGATQTSEVFKTSEVWGGGTAGGTGIEPVMTGGMDNPVDVAFMPGGERIFTTTFLQHPAGGRRDGLIHAVYGGIYGKDHSVIHAPAHRWTGPDLMPVLTHLGPAAPCGLTRYESQVFGKEYQDNLFACLFNMRKVTRHVLHKDGATFKTTDSDFLVSDNRDFHPTDVLEDADGSLLVIDTGGWYKLCCPTSQLHKPDVLGGIYRIRRKGAAKVEDPRGLKLKWPKLGGKDEMAGEALKLTQRLDDPRPAVRGKAIEALGAGGPPTTTVLKVVTGGARSVELSRNAVWAATRINHADARAAVREALTHADESVRQAAIHSASVWRDHDAIPELIKLLKGKSLFNRRAAAAALGRIGDKSAVPALLEALRDVERMPRPDDAQTGLRVLEHSLTYALIEIADPEATAEGLKSSSSAVRRGALVALDQMEGGKLDAKTVMAQLAVKDTKRAGREYYLKESAAWILSRHPEWGAQTAGYYKERLTKQTLTESEADELTRQLARLARSEAIQKMMAACLGRPGAGSGAVMRAMADAGLKEAPKEWTDALGHLAYHADAGAARAAVATLRALKAPKESIPSLTATLTKLGMRENAPADLRLAALAALPGGLRKVDRKLFDFLRSKLAPVEPVAVRGPAAQVLARAKLGDEQLLTLAKSLEGLGPMELDRVLDAFSRSSNEEVGQALLASLKTANARSSLRGDRLKKCLAKFGPRVQRQAEELYGLIDADAARQKEQLEETLTALKGGDVRRGQAVFNSAKAACASCHAIGYLGGKVGPDLTRIGKVRVERDLLESILFPSASFVQSYESVQITTKSGKVHNGLLREGAPDEVVLAINATEEVRVSRDDIEEIVPSKVSVMPAGVDKLLTPQEMADLVAFLKACR